MTKMKAEKALCQISPKDKFRPMVFVVGEDVYLYFYAALRAAYRTDMAVEVVPIDQAYAHYHDCKPTDLPNRRVMWEEDVLGSLYSGSLFADICVFPDDTISPVVCETPTVILRNKKYNKYIISRIDKTTQNKKLYKV